MAQLLYLTDLNHISAFPIDSFPKFYVEHFVYRIFDVETEQGRNLFLEHLL